MVSRRSREFDRTISALGPKAATLRSDEVPASPGLYTIQAISAQACEALGLSNHQGHEPLARRVLYLGKAEDSVRTRLSGRHFATGETGRSTMRRTLAALLDLPVVPRPTRISNPTRRQLMTATSNFALGAADDEWLTAWMYEHLVVRAVESRWRPLRDLERAAGAVLKPPLDQERSPLWLPNPWREQVAVARKGKRESLRRQLDLQ